MDIISVEEFNKKATFGDSRHQKIYQEKLLIQGPVFALSQKKSALEYAQVYFKKHSKALCLLVQEKYYFQIWNEEVLIKNIKKNISSYSKEKSVSIQDNDVLYIQKTDRPAINTKKALEFNNICRELLSKSIGPISNLICKKTLSEYPNSTCQQFIENIAKKIPEKEESAQFKRILLQFTEQNIGLTTLVKDLSEHLKKYSEKIDRITNLELEEIVSQMRDVGGLQIKDRRYRLRTYPNCFVGQEAVDWMVNHLNISTEQAIRLGQRLMDEKIIHHVVCRENFRNEYLFYRFYWDKK